MIPKKPAPGHSRPKDGVASLAYDPGGGYRFSEKIMLEQEARALL
jgi:hypothetical protein